MTEIQIRKLARRILVVAKQGGMGRDWAAYIGVVRGVNHDNEWQHVADYGDKVPYEVAKALFPTFAEKYMWRE